MRKILAVFLSLMILISGCSLFETPEPDRCAICDSIPYHAPCILNLSTGEMLELSIYDPHFTLVAELAEEQRGGYFSFIRGAGVEGIKLGAESAQISFPMEPPSMEEKYFFRNCRETLNDYAADGFILLDMKDTDQPVIYPIKEGATFSLRCYDVSISTVEDENEFQVFVKGTLDE